jgi:hypothetical protein
MKKSALVSSNSSRQFVSQEDFLSQFGTSVDVSLFNLLKHFIRESEYDGTLLHTYTEFDLESQTYSQIFASNDIDLFFKRLYTYTDAMFDSVRQQGWTIVRKDF